MPALNAVRNYSAESWRRVAAIADLADIFEPAMQVCSWQRPANLIPASYSMDVAGHSSKQIREVLNIGDRAQLAGLPNGGGKEFLLDDVALLTEILCELVDCPSVGLRYASVESAMCPSWHIDRVPIRLLCTYKGPGTEWLDDQGIDKARLKDPAVVSSSCQRAAAGDVVLLKGSLWQGNEGFGAIHRSPSITPDEPQRTLLTMDPLWPD